MELYEHSLSEIRKKLISGEVSSLEVTNAVFDRIEEVEPHVGAFVTLTKESALESAKKADELITDKKKSNALSELSPIVGIPMALKDNMCTKGVLTTCSSKMLENFVPPYDATVVKLINKACGVSVGKTNMDELAMGSSTETSYFKKTHNPWDLERVPGGSSGGSVASVAAGEAFWSLGTDTGGSIRQPASLCGLVGMKPTYGMVSRYGVVAFASSLDQVGSITRNVEDCAMVMNVISKHDQKDSTSMEGVRPDYTATLGKSIKGMRIGMPKEYFGPELDSNLKALITDSISRLEAMGAVVVDISLPYSKYIMEIYYALSAGEASSNFSRFDGIRYGYHEEGARDVKEQMMNTRTKGFGPEVKRRLMMGTYFIGSDGYKKYYEKAMKVRTLVLKDVRNAFSQCDCFVSPTTISPAFKFGEKIEDPISMYLSDSYTTIGNISGIPSISVPCGFINDLPMGIQFSSNLFCEPTLLQVGYALEKDLDLKKKMPKINIEGGKA